MPEPSVPSNEAIQPITSFSVLMYRVLWCFGGPVVLCFLLLKIAIGNDGWITASDIAFPLVLVATVAARWMCFRNGDRSNTMGEITTGEELRRYSVSFAIGGALAWVVANIVGNHLLR